MAYLPTLMQLFVADNYQDKLPAIPGMDFSSLALADKSEANSSRAWDDTLENVAAGVQLPLQPPFSAPQSDNLGVIQKQDQESLEQLFPNGFPKRQDSVSHPQGQEEWQVQNDVYATIAVIIFECGREIFLSYFGNCSSEKDIIWMEVLKFWATHY